MCARAQEGSCSRIKVNEASKFKGKKTAPGCVFLMGLRVTYYVFSERMVLCHVNNKPWPKSAQGYTSAQGAARPLVAEYSEIFTELGLSGPESMG